MVASCFVAVYDHGKIITDLSSIRRRYLRGRCARCAAAAWAGRAAIAPSTTGYPQLSTCQGQATGRLACQAAASGCARRFWIDLLTTIPFELIILRATGLDGSEGTTARYISMLRLLKLVRRRRRRMAATA